MNVKNQKRNILFVIGVVSVFIVLSLVVGSAVASDVPVDTTDSVINESEYDSLVQDSSDINNFVELANNSEVIGLSEGSVTGESVTAVVGSYVNLSNTRLVNGSVEVSNSTGSVMTEGTDYQIDYVEGRIKALTGGAITDGNNITIDYTFEHLGLEVLNTSDGSVKLNVSSDINESRILAFAISKDLINSSASEVVVDLDNESIEVVGSLSDLVSSSNDSYYPVSNYEDTSVILVHIQEFSTHELDFYEGIQTTFLDTSSIEDRLTSEFYGVPVFVWLIGLAGLFVVVFASKDELGG